MHLTTLLLMLLPSFSYGKGPQVIVDVTMTCDLPVLRNGYYFQGDFSICEGDYWKDGADLMSTKYYMNTPGVMRYITKAISWNEDDGPLNTDLEPFLNISHNCYGERSGGLKRKVDRVYLPDCTQIFNRKYCYYKANIRFGLKLIPTTELIESIR